MFRYCFSNDAPSYLIYDSTFVPPTDVSLVNEDMGSLSIFRVTRRFPLPARPYSSEKMSPWYIDNKPGPYPKTEEEKVAAAKKYGMLREEYEPYPDDGNGCGDYPKIEPIPLENKSPIYTWSDSFHRRNYLEPISVDFPFYTTGRITNERYKHSKLRIIGSFFLVMGLISAVFLSPWCKEYRYHAPILEKQYPKPGVTHYSFELTSEGSGLKH